MDPVAILCVRDSDHLYVHTVHRPLPPVSSCRLRSLCVPSLTATVTTHRVVAHSPSLSGTTIQHQSPPPTARHDVWLWQFRSHRCISIAQNGFRVW